MAVNMRISELSDHSGTPVPTIKYYLREGLLQRGEATAANQASYGEAHLRRLQLIRILTEVGKLSIAAVHAVVDALENNKLPVHEVVGVAQYALGPRRDDPPDDAVRLALEEVDDFLYRRRWRVTPDAPSRRTLAESLVALRLLGRGVDAQDFDHYADVASELASWELDQVPLQGSRSSAVESVVVGTVVFEVVLNALRRLAHEDHSARRAVRRRRA